MALTPRATKGTPLFNAEIDAAFNGLDVRVTTAQTAAATAQTTANGRLLGSSLKTVGGNSLVGSGDIAIGSGSSETVVGYLNTWPLDAAGFGKTSSLQSMTANRVIIEGAGVSGGSYHVTMRQNATGGWTLTLPATWIQRGSDAFGTAPGATTKVVVEKMDTGDVVYAFVPLSILDATAPTFAAHSIEEAQPANIVQLMSEAVGLPLPVAADITTTNAGGRTITGIARSGSYLVITYNSAFTYDVVPSIAIAAGKVFDLAGNAAGALATSVVSNNRTIPVPNAVAAPTLGTATTTTQPLTWPAPAADSTHGPATQYQPQYKANSSGTWLDFGSPIGGLSVTITGLVAATSYNYRLLSANATGPSAGTAGISTGSTASGSSAYITPSVAYVLGALPTIANANVYDDWLINWGNAAPPQWKDTGAFAGVPVGLIGTQTRTNFGTRFAEDGAGARCFDISWPYAAGGGASGTNTESNYEPATPGTLMKTEFPVVCTPGQQDTLLINALQRRYEFGNSSTVIGFRVVITFANGEIAPVTYDLTGTTGDYGYVGGCMKFDYKPSTSTSLTVSVQELPSGPALHSLGGFYGFGFQCALLSRNT